MNKNNATTGAGKPAQFTKDPIVEEAILYSVSVYGLSIPNDDITYHFLETLCKRYSKELSRKGGSSTSKAKKRSSANNGKLGGRPKGSKNKLCSFCDGTGNDLFLSWGFCGLTGSIYTSA